MNNGTLLSCPNCAIKTRPNGKLFPQILGRLLPNGQLVILRYHAGTTVIQSANIALTCGCGFTFFIEGNHIEGTAVLQL